MTSLIAKSNRITGHRPLRWLIAFIALAGMTATAQTLLWEEDFNDTGSIDPNIWTAEIGTGSQYGLTGWGNNELQSYTADQSNVRVDGSNLVITATEPSNNSFRSARIKTQNKLTFQYGRVEARINTPDLANGLWPAFWTLGNLWQQGETWAACGEIDIMEMGNKDAITAGKVNSRVGSAAHWRAWPNNVQDSKTKDMTPDIDGSFVTYRMDWTPSSITTYINDQQIWSKPISGIQEFQKPHFLILNLAVGGNYTGITSEGGITAPFPAEMRVDWIRLYDNGHTILGGSGAPQPNTPPSFTDITIVKAGAVAGAAYTGQTLDGEATDPDGDPLTYFKIPGGPAWLNVATNGILSGIPGGSDAGLNRWTVEVSDGNGGSDTVPLEIMVDSALPPPTMSIQVSGSDLQILWPSSYTTYSLYGTTNLMPPVTWSAVTNSPTNQGDEWMVSLPIVGAPDFFRLQNP